MRCLIVSGDLAFVREIRDVAEAARFQCALTTSGEEADEILVLQPFELIVIGPRLPDVSALMLLRGIRRRKIGIPVMVCGDGLLPIDRVELIEAGADEAFAAHPGKREMLARLRQLMVRSLGQASTCLSIGPITVDLDAALAMFNGKPARLSARVYAVLEALALRKGRLLSREQLIDVIYNGRDEPDVRAIDVFVCTLRRKMHEAGIDDPDALLQTVRGQGFVLNEIADEAPALRAA